MPGNVFEAANRTLKEFFVGATERGVTELRTLHMTRPPAQIAHWDFLAQEIDYREVERGLPDADLQPFIASYSRSIAKEAWKVISG